MTATRLKQARPLSCKSAAVSLTWITKQCIYDAAPVIRNDRTLVPIRIITEALGGKVDWNGATKEVTLSINDKEIRNDYRQDA